MLRRLILPLSSNNTVGEGYFDIPLFLPEDEATACLRSVFFLDSSILIIYWTRSKWNVTWITNYLSLSFSVLDRAENILAVLSLLSVSEETQIYTEMYLLQVYSKCTQFE